MDILLLTDVYFPRVNGVSTSIRTLARGLAASGHRVTVVAPDYPGDDRATDAAEPFEILRLPARTLFFDPEDRLLRTRPLRRTARVLAKRRWDVIHVHTPFQAHRLGAWLRRQSRAPVLETYHTYFEEYVRHYLPWLPDRLLRLSARRLSRHLCNGVDHLVVPTAEMLAVLRGYDISTAATVVPTGIPLEEFHGGDGARFRSALGIAADAPTLVTVSRLAREKNIEFLLRVVQRLLPAHPALRFIVSGEGPDRARLEALAGELGIAPSVRFCGNLDRRGPLLDCYRAGDVFVFASPTETQGLVLIEALALGVPVVSTAVLGTASVLRGARGARIAEEAVEPFAAAVASLLQSPQARAALAAAGPADAQAWSAPALVAKLEALYRQCAAGAAAQHDAAPVQAPLAGTDCD